ncbi:MAG TPA: phosphate/phosphite/phosphonate ABC transporter substrate-binding protein [Terrimicrobiaceae bacterium]|nr:phosphate/phosphite/phosphonate ABC transporter substrate-binding protein [Terrimicrobiaceae bacterium]
MKKLSLFLLLAPLVAAARLWAADAPARMVVALKPDKDPDAMVAERKALADDLAAKLGRPVEVIVPLSAAVIVEGLANGTIDLAYLSATDAINARQSGAADVLLAGEIDGRTSYPSYWVALKEKPYQSIADLKGKPVAFASKTSTSGYVVPLWDLHQQGFVSGTGRAEEFFGADNTWYGTGYVSAIERVLNGDAEAAAVSYYVLDKDKHLTPEQRAKLRMIDQQGPVPTHVIAVRAAVSGTDRAKLREALLALDPALRDRVFSSKLVEVDADAHLGSLGEAIALAKRGSE